ncbi:class I SAM-dependent methyltransferase [Mucilaginibacter sp.]|uniref:class I SAM-dependent methyltransferase n=1 Tax=Mucilaginibacter sp. TaxID=1882438 RepID=UPI002843B41D|nr:class I SAM-dependent methyltransferase [Mucilaginibacter sp.]MDR3697524.1 class I SAM-dependent methyltransferase [Mucilaginibacter sp.]
MTIRSKVNALKYSRITVARLTYGVLKKAWYLSKLLFNQSYRSKYYTQLKFGNYYFQKESYSTPNRYPHLFTKCKIYLNEVANLQILSFGCATGQEVFTLGAYLPHAAIMGVDINAWCLKQCKKKNGESRFSFFHRFSKEFIKSANFDAIFCLAVFQRSENRTETRDTALNFTFEKFEAEIIMLDKKLKRGGLFIIDNTDFSFTDTVCSIDYKPLEFETNKMVRERPLFDRNNRKIADIQENYRMFMKQ